MSILNFTSLSFMFLLIIQITNSKFITPQKFSSFLKSTINSNPRFNLDILKARKMKNCTVDNCKNGKCIDTNKCACNDNFFDLSSILLNQDVCNYTQKLQKYAILFESIIPCAGHMYSGRILFGLIKLLSLLILYYVRNIFINNELGKRKFINKSVNTLIIILIIVLNIFDLANFWLNNYNDGYGIPLISI